MIEWAKAGRDILSQNKNLAPIEKALLESSVQTAELAAGALLTPVPDIAVEPKLNLNQEWMRQSQRYIDFGFHTKLGLTEEEYLDSLPKFEPQPEAFKGRFDIPVIVETRILPQEQAALAKLNYYLGELKIADWSKDPNKYKTPDKPYTTWMQDGKGNLNKSVENVRKALAKDERGASIFDCIALFIARPEILKDHSIDLPGTSVGSVDAACLGVWFDRPEVCYGRVGHANPGFVSASCGRV